MNPNLQKEIWQEMRSLGDRLQKILLPDPRHPRGRNPYAHVAGCVKARFGCSYGDVPDVRVGELREFLEQLEREEREKSGASA